MGDSPKWVCAKCGKSEGLWQGVTVSGWFAIKVEDQDGKPLAKRDGPTEVNHGDEEEQSEFGCGECGASWWQFAEGVKKGIRDCPKCAGVGCPRCGYAGKVDIDEPPVLIHPEQQRFAA